MINITPIILVSVVTTVIFKYYHNQLIKFN